MNRLVCVALLGAVALCAAAAAVDKYPEKFNIDVDALLKDEQQVKQYITCLLQDADANCPEPGKALKAILSDALSNDCARCTDKQKVGAVKVIGYLTQTKPDVWKALINKYDPAGNFAKNHPDLAA